MAMSNNSDNLFWYGKVLDKKNDETKSGQLKSYKIGSRILYKRSEITQLETKKQIRYTLRSNMSIKPTKKGRGNGKNKK